MRQRRTGKDDDENKPSAVESIAHKHVSAISRLTSNPRAIVFVLTSIIVSSIITLIWEKHPELLHAFVHNSGNDADQTLRMVVFFGMCGALGFTVSNAVAWLVKKFAIGPPS